MDIPTIIRRHRLMLRLSQRQLAEHLQVSPSAAAQWETGRAMPSLAHRVELATLFSLPFADLLPELADIGDVLVRDAQTRALVHSFEKLDSRLRESVLLVVATILSSQQPLAKAG